MREFLTRLRHQPVITRSGQMDYVATQRKGAVAVSHAAHDIQSPDAMNQARRNYESVTQGGIGEKGIRLIQGILLFTAES